MLKTNQCINIQALLAQVHSDNQSGQFYDFIQNKMLFGSRYNVYSPVPRMPIASQNAKPAGGSILYSVPCRIQLTEFLNTIQAEDISPDRIQILSLSPTGILTVIAQPPVVQKTVRKSLTKAN
ncbi:hypothetical protein [Pantoea septica]|uniref:hypothetical protein n=1 Tax=Pantoea septica TaxID=472695 RepID=UPI0023F06FED|nr:hypothetical protein [Pantoea septica]